MKDRLADILYLAAIVVLALAALVLAQSVNGVSTLFQREQILGVLILGLLALTHVPALLPVTRVPLCFSRLPPAELLFPATIFLFWAVVSLALDAQTSGERWLFAVLGVVFAVSGGLGFWSRKLFLYWFEKLSLHAAPNPKPGTIALKTTSMRFAFLVRVLAVTLSVIGGLSYGALSLGALGWIAILALASGLASLGIVIAGLYQIKKQALAAQRNADAALTELEKASGPAEVLLHASAQPTALHRRIRTLSKELGHEGVRRAIICREAIHMPLLQEFGADYVWLAPFISSLDAVARPTARVVIYTHDGQKNGHFARFNHLSHILDATTGQLARSETLHAAFNMYDYVIAPSPEVASLWRAELSDDQAERVITLDFSPLKPLPSKSVLGAKTDVAVALPAPKSERDYPSPDEMHALNSLVDRFKSEAVVPQADEDGEVSVRPASPPVEKGQLHIGIRATEDDPLTAWHKSLLALGDDANHPHINTYLEPSVATWNRAEIIVAGSSDQVTRLRATSKPILWSGSDTAPPGALELDVDNSAPLYVQAEQRAQPEPLHFTSCRALLDHIEAAKTAPAE